MTLSVPEQLAARPHKVREVHSDRVLKTGDAIRYSHLILMGWVAPHYKQSPAISASGFVLVRSEYDENEKVREVIPGELGLRVVSEDDPPVDKCGRYLCR